MTSNKQDIVEETAQQGEAIAANALMKADNLLSKVAVLRYHVHQMKDELSEKLAVETQKKQTDV